MLFGLFFLPLIATIILILAIFPYAIKFGFIDHPSARKKHDKPTPPIGGLAIFLGTLLTLSIYDIQMPHQGAFILALTLLVVVGAIDDYRELNVKLRLAAQICAGLIMTEFADIKINDMGDLLGYGTLHLGHYSTALTVFAVVGGINAFNMIDGIDGLSSSSSLISIGLVALLAFAFNNPLLLNLSIIFMGAIIAFLLFNLRIFGRSKGLIFLGDSGSTLLGFTICWLIIQGSQHPNPIMTPTLVLWVIALPLYDSICIMMRRIHKGKSPFAPDREHLHHVLPMKGFSINETLLIILASSLLLAGTAIVSSVIFKVADNILFFAFLICFASFYAFMHNTIEKD
jgi:UDP-GlcNAc:undecaprenyl-phosphate GlcNAc-1-phosphate transferase